jgi:2-(1,2-epoxy-1,2-dihydrophenyl)acetyl-CoA isomerase
MSEAVQQERRGAVLEIVLDRPDSLNAISPELIAGVIAGLEAARADDLRAVVLRGAGRGFCAGGDIKRFEQMLASDEGVDRNMPDELHRMIEIIRELPKPVVAVVHGPCAGAGFSLAIACDLVIAADDAVFNLAYSKLGLSPDGSSTYFLPRHLGLKKAAELLFMPRRMTSAEMLELGLINESVPADELLARGRAVADELAAGPTRAFAAVKSLLASTFDSTLHDQLQRESDFIESVSQSADFTEGVRAFLGKRPPKFTGH